MSSFSDSFQWRETYFVLFHAQRRPQLQDVERLLQRLDGRFQLSEQTAGQDGGFESLKLLAPDDFAALDISYASGEEVTEEWTALAEELAAGLDAATLDRLNQCDARLDVLHFEQVMSADLESEEGDEMLDPSSLLMVLGALAELTGGLAVDPQSGAVM